MIKKGLLCLSLLFSSLANSECWVITNLHGYASMSGDKYKYIEDGTTGSVFHVTIDGDAASVIEANSGYSPEMAYVPLSPNTMVGTYQSGGGVTVETWSITNDKKALYSKVMNTPGMQIMTSTKAFVGDVVGRCKE